MRWLNSITISADMNLSILQEIVEDRGAWHTAIHVCNKLYTTYTYYILNNNKIIETEDVARIRDP